MILFIVNDTQENEIIGSYVINTIDMETAKKKFMEAAFPLFKPLSGCFKDMCKTLSEYEIDIMVLDLDKAQKL